MGCYQRVSERTALRPQGLRVLSVGRNGYQQGRQFLTRDLADQSSQRRQALFPIHMISRSGVR